MTASPAAPESRSGKREDAMPVKSSNAKPVQEPASEEPVWTYRGYQLKSSEFVTAMVHLFRAEIQRANVWRQRLDTTTNWAVVATGAALSIAFGQPAVHHGVIILNTLLITWFLFIEARRYRYYELWSYRIRLMETDFYAAMLVPPFQPSPEWAESLAENLLSPKFPISIWEAFGRRLRRNYLWIYAILGASWLAKSFLFPQPTTSLAEFIERGSVGPLPGHLVVTAGLAYYSFLVLVAIGTIGMTRATGEVLPRFGGDTQDQHGEYEEGKGLHTRFFPAHRRRQYLALIITDQAEAVSERILTDLKRGVTAVSGKGMYTGQEKSILLCALTVTEVYNLKAAVAKKDPNAFVIVSPAQEVLGRGFIPLEKK
ncbi:MAG: DUF2270 domain-containing protein [Chloroflexi bacterium]|nr:DUF2270 domain-containing protein [Anaerolineae bacterium]MBL1171735.1 DUF2270 domain-containing protein [Chloroflexota bacterium]MDL1926730.1 DUF2270 domain-containing protein [Anaerolineae bacterium AMX1]